MSRLLVAILAGAIAVSACTPAATTTADRQEAMLPPTRLEDGAADAAVSHLAGALRMYKQGQYRQATRALQRTLEAYPEDYQAAYLMGLSYLQRGRYVDARNAFRLALELGPDHHTAAHIHSGIAVSFESVRQSRMAHHHYHAACKAYKPCVYAQSGATRTEYRDLEKPREREKTRLSVR